MSGRAAFAHAAALAGSLPADRLAGLRAIRDPRDGRLLDRALVLIFPGPGTSTGEDVVELHVHGGRAVVAAVEDTLAGLPGMRRAEPGEFTRRALVNGVIDLTEAEGLADLLAADTETQRRAALQVADGGVSALIRDWTADLVGIAADVEAQLDFADESDVVHLALASDAAAVRSAALAAAIAQVLAQPPVERLHAGIHVVLAGPPNSGKSSLINALTGRDVAIVSATAGTTRDRIEAAVTREGIAYVLIDTAGLTDDATIDPVEQIGVARARSALAMADVVVWLGDGPPEPGIHDALRIHARADRPDRHTPPQSGRYLAVSAVTGAGMSELWAAIAARSRALLPREDAIATNRRQRILLGECRQHLDLAAGQVRDDLLLVAEELRLAGRALDMVTGRDNIEAVLDALFARFCVGK